MIIRVVLIGPPGVGKGTQGALLESRLGCVQLSSGNIFRAEIEAKTDLGMLAKRYIDQGRLVPNGVTIQMMAKRMSAPECLKHGFILDGFPRTVEQAKALDGLFEELDQPMTGVISLEVSQDIVVTRLSGRIGCTKCGAIYHQTNNPPKREWICDRCNSPLFIRDDDKPETVRERLRVFQENTRPVVEYYASHGVLHHIDAGADPEVVYQEIITKLGIHDTD